MSWPCCLTHCKSAHSSLCVSALTLTSKLSVFTNIYVFTLSFQVLNLNLKVHQVFSSPFIMQTLLTDNISFFMRVFITLLTVVPSLYHLTFDSLNLSGKTKALLCVTDKGPINSHKCWCTIVIDYFPPVIANVMLSIIVYCVRLS